MKYLLTHLGSVVSFFQEHPRVVSIVGAASGWASLDFLRYSQIVAATLAALVSVCALILTVPKAIAEVRSWFRPRV